MEKQVMLKIYGWVQGVFFRDSAQKKAKELKLVGWVSNASDGTVEVLAEGEEEKLKELIKWCYNGPRLAKVDKVDVEWQEATGQFKEFGVKY